MEKDSPSSRTTKSSFFSRSANFGNVSPFLVGATNTFSELIHPLIKLPNCVLKFYNLYAALGSFGLLPLRGAGTGFVGVLLPLPLILILHFIYYISRRSNANARFFFLSLHTPYGRVRQASLALKTLTPRFTDFFTDFEKKKPIVLQSTGKSIFLTFARRKSYNTVKHQHYAVKSQYHLVQSPIS